MTIETNDATNANDAIVAETQSNAKRSAKRKVYTHERFIAADAESRIVDAIRALAKRREAATTRAIAERCANVASYREVRQALRRLRRHHVVDASVVVRSDERRVRVFALAATNAKRAKRADAPIGDDATSGDE